MNTEIETLNSISIKVSRLEVMQETNTKAIGDLVSGINRLVERLERSDDIAKEANQRAKSAQKRLDKVDKIIFWVCTTIGGSLLLAFVGFIVSGGLA